MDARDAAAAAGPDGVLRERGPLPERAPAEGAMAEPSQEPCTECKRTVVVNGVAVVDGFLLRCGHCVCALCMPHFMQVALPLQPVCQGVPGDVRQACSEDVILLQHEERLF